MAKIQFNENQWDCFVDLKYTTANGPEVVDYGKSGSFLDLVSIAFTNAFC